MWPKATAAQAINNSKGTSSQIEVETMALPIKNGMAISACNFRTRLTACRLAPGERGTSRAMIVGNPASIRIYMVANASKMTTSSP